MKKFIFAIAAMAAALMVSSCVEPGEEYVHDNCQISSIYITNPQYNTVQQIYGDIDQETGEISFGIPAKVASYWKDEEGNVIPVKVRATVGFDVKITPSLSGLKDLNSDEGYEITVTATQTGNSKNYVLKAYFKRADRD